MARRHARGPVLSSVVMVGLATAATGLLALVGLQGLPEGVLPSTFGGHESRAPRQVDVSETPTPSRTTPPATPTPAQTTTPPSRTVTVTRTTAPAPSSPAPATTQPQPTTPAPSPSPSPTCTKKSGRCHGGAQAAPYGMSSFADKTGAKPGRRTHGHSRHWVG